MPENEELLSGLILELRRGTIVLCVLSRLEKPKYGYNLITELAERGVSVEANTLYPLLRRLESQGLLESSWQTEGAKPRKYYVMTQKGKEICAALTKSWKTTAASVKKLIEEGGADAE